MIVGQPWMRLLLPVDGGPVCPPPDNARVAGDGMIIFLPGMACVLILTYLSNHMITCWKQGCVSGFGFMGLAPTPGRRESMRCGLQKANDVWMRRAPKADGTPCIPSMFSFTFFVMPRMRLVSRCAAHLRMSPERRTAVMALQVNFQNRNGLARLNDGGFSGIAIGSWSSSSVTRQLHSHVDSVRHDEPRFWRRRGGTDKISG